MATSASITADRRQDTGKGAARAMAMALEDATLHADEALPLSFRMMLLGGMALVVSGISLGVWRSYHVIARERMGALLVLGAFLAIASDVNGVVVVVVFDLVLLGALMVEHFRIEARPATT